jgi:hypothetical protein
MIGYGRKNRTTGFQIAKEYRPMMKNYEDICVFQHGSSRKDYNIILHK